MPTVLVTSMAIIALICIVVVVTIACNFSSIKKMFSGYGQEFFCRDCIHCWNVEGSNMFVCKNNRATNSDLDYKITGEKYNGNILTCAFVRQYFDDNCGYLPKEGVKK